MSRRTKNTKKGAARASNESNEPETSEGSDEETTKVPDKVSDDEDEWPWPATYGTIDLVNGRIEDEGKEENHIKSPNPTVREFLRASAKFSFAEIAREGETSAKTPKQIAEAFGELMEQRIPDSSHISYQDVLSEMLQGMLEAMISCLIATKKPLFPDEDFDAVFKKFVGKFLGVPGGRIEKWSVDLVELTTPA